MSYVNSQSVRQSLINLELDSEVGEIEVNNFGSSDREQWDAGLVVTTWNRPEYLEKCLASLGFSSISDCIVVIVDDNSDDPLTKSLIRNVKISAKTIILYKTVRTNVNVSLDIGWSLLRELQCQFLLNLDSDTLVKPNWLSILRETFNYLDLPKDRLILSGFNRHNAPCILSDNGNHVVKSRMGGINYYFKASVFELVRPFLAHDSWDSVLQDYFKRNRFSQFNLVATKPSVVQHIGKQGLNSNGIYDYAIDFEEKEKPPTKYVISRRNTGIGDCLISLFSAWLYARETNRTLVIDWRFTPYAKNTEANLFNELFVSMESIDGVPVITDIHQLNIGKYPSIFPANRELDKFGDLNKHSNQSSNSERKEVLDTIRLFEERVEEYVVLDHCLNWDDMLFTYGCRKFFKLLTPKKEIYEAITGYQSSYFNDLPIVGIHIRHGNGGNIMDHSNHWRQEALERCTESINHLVENYSDKCRLFLSTDSSFVESYFEERYSNLLVTEKYLRPQGEGELHHDRSQNGLALQALVDLYLLSCATVLIRFPEGSFFSQVSAHLFSDTNKPDPKIAKASAIWNKGRGQYDPVICLNQFKKLSCLITFRDDGNCRIDNLQYIIKHLSNHPELEIVIVEQDSSPSIEVGQLPEGTIYQFVFNDGLFNKSWGINIAAKLSSGETLMVCDADIVIDLETLQSAADQVDMEINAVTPYSALIDLTEDETKLLLSGNKNINISRNQSEINRVYQGQVPPFCGGLFLVRREIFYAIGGMDERFRGWGAEDNAISMRIFDYSTKNRILEGKIAYHLWHTNDTSKTSESPSYISNSAYLASYREFGSSLINRLKLDQDRIGDIEKYVSYASAKETNIQESKLLPLVSCLCVTRGRVHLLTKAVQYFHDQTYPNKELIIICEDDDTDTVNYASQIKHPNVRIYVENFSGGKNLGQLRNLSVSLAHGEYFCQWDDDDWFAPDRIMRQLGFIKSQSKLASILPRWHIYSEPTQEAYVSSVRMWEGSILCRTNIFADKKYYDEFNRGEDTVLIKNLIAMDGLAVVDCPELYVYYHSGENTWGNEHFQKIIEGSTPLDSNLTGLIKSRFDGHGVDRPNNRIPKIIHQTAKSKNISTLYKNLQVKLIGFHPHWQYRFYDNSECRQLIFENMPEVLEIYDNLSLDIQRVDFFRLVVVYLHGGFYVDMDVELLKPLDDLVENQCVFAEERTLSDEQQNQLNHQYSLRVANYMFGAVPKDPFLAKLLVDISTKAINYPITCEDDVLESTGPGRVTNSFHEYKQKEEITLLKNEGVKCQKCNRESCSFGMYGLHHHQGSWRWRDEPLSVTRQEESLTYVVHQTWKSKKLPNFYGDLSKTWKDKHPDWQHYLWTDENNRNLIEMHYPWFLETYDRYPFEIQRVDAARYFILYSLGGLYVDLDFRCIKAIEPLLGEAQLTLGIEHQKHNHWHNKSRIIGNAFIYAKSSGNEFLRAVIEELAEPPTLPKDHQHYVLETTGPFMISRVYENFTNKTHVNLVPANYLYPIDSEAAESLLKNKTKEAAFLKSTDAFALHYHCGSWWK